MKTHTVRSIRQIDDIQEDWAHHGTFPRMDNRNALPMNLAHIIERRSDAELYIMNTEGVEMLFKVKS